MAGPIASPSPDLERDFYAVLEVECTAELAVIRESYRRLALKWHPDKNRASSTEATRRFQELGRAWEVLRDGRRRREYDEVRLREGRFVAERWWEKRKWREGEEERDEEDVVGKARRRREDVDREASARFRRESAASGFSEEEEQQQHFADERQRRARAVGWKVMARLEYRSKLRSWIEFRGARCGEVMEVRCRLGKYEGELAAQRKESDMEVTRKFHEAIERSRESGCDVKDHATILAKLLEARTKYTQRLIRDIEEGRNRLENLMRELERDSRRYEEEEARARQNRIREALDMLGPRDLNPPLFAILDRRGLAINHWKALSRIKDPIRYPSMWDPAEGPWHESGRWERVAGEHICGRCDEPAFHFIAECGPARCPGCGLIVCNDCYRDLKLLQEYGDWMLSSEGEMRDSLFALDVDLSS